MSKLSLSDVVATTINQNNGLIEAAFDNTISRDGSSPNQMNSNIDMNHHDIINVSHLSADDVIINSESVIQRIADEASLRAAADTALSTRISSLENGDLVDVHKVNPLQFGAKGDGVHDDTYAIQQMVDSDYTVVDWLGAEYTWLINDTITVSKPNITWYGSSLVKMDRHGLWCKPMVIVLPSAENFWTADTISWDHDAENVPGCSRVTDLALAMGVAFLIQSNFSHGGGRFYNSFDVGLAFASFDFTGDGSPEKPYDVFNQRNAYPIACSFGTVYGKNCGCGEHVTVNGTFKQGSAVDILTSSCVNGVAVIADECWAGFICDFASQASASVGTIIARGTKQDSRLPGGSGMGIYNGGLLTVGAYYGSNNAGIDIVCYNQSWALTMGAAFCFASGQQGVFLGGSGWCSGRFHIAASSLLTNGLPAFNVAVASNAENVFLDVNLTTWGSTHGQGYYANNNASGTIQGRVTLIDRGATVAPFFSNGSEHIDYTDDKGNVTHYSSTGSKHSFGGAVNTASRALLQVPAGVGVGFTSNNVQGLSFNCYYNGANWIYANNGYAALYQFNPGTGQLLEYLSATGTAGSPITFQLFRTMGPTGEILGTPLAISSGGTGGTTQAAARAGIGVTAVGAATSNMAGTWTPTLQFGGNTTGITYTSRTGKFTRVGNVVFFSAQLTLSSKGTTTGAATISGLSTPNATQYAVADTFGITMANYVTNHAIIAPGTALINLYAVSATGDQPLTDTSFTNTSTFVVSGVYDVGSLT
ncbi:hypothetical protein [Rhizobium sp. RCC_161_2]|uniref:hypothetical protein n=1 Tax=Rhizobium sp. RCC_161_2 TaxID=3239219 RepID=UPI0035248E66